MVGGERITSYSAGIDSRRQIMTSRVDPHTVTVNIFILVIGIEMKRKELTKRFMIISNWKNPLVSMVYTQIWLRFKG